MYDPSNFSISLESGNLINLVTGGITSLVFNIKNLDENINLYNLNFELVLGDGIEIIDSSVPYTSIDNNKISFVNVKDLAPNEINYKINIDIKLKSKFNSGENIPFNTLILCTFSASADTMPRGNYDNNNEIIEGEVSFSVKACKFIIYKTNSNKILLGKTYTSKIIIKTAESLSTFFYSIEDILGNGMMYLGNMSIIGYESLDLANVQIIQPDSANNSYKLSWSNIYIPANTTVTIQYDVKANEKYYINGSLNGKNIIQGDSIENILSIITTEGTLSYSYYFAVFEILVTLMLSKYAVDINTSVSYYIKFESNLYHGVFGLSAHLRTSRGQVMGNSSTPMFSSKTVGQSGITDIYWNVGPVNAGVSVLVSMDGAIDNKYIDTGLNIFSGDIFDSSITCTATSEISNKIITVSDSASMSIDLPKIYKSIIGIYYRDNTLKQSNIVAPGDYIAYESIYDSSNVMAPSKDSKLFDFYPYNTLDINNINYNYSSQQYPGTTPVVIDPYGQLWYVNQIVGGQSFSINYRTQISYVNVAKNFLYNLFKLQLKNTEGITYSYRDQVGFKMGKPNLILNKSVIGNDINRIKIGEKYTFTVNLMNDNSNNDATDAFNFTLTENIPTGVTLDTAKIVCKINGNPISYNIENGNIIVGIDKLGANETFVLAYEILVNNTLGPNKTFVFNSITTIPYTQVYDVNNTNLQYDISAINKDVYLKSENIQLSIYRDQNSKIVGEEVFYYLKIIIPKGQKISSLYGLIIIPSRQNYLQEAFLNGNPITPNVSNNNVIFPSINNIDSTSTSIIYEYKIKCIVTDSLVSSKNPSYTVEGLYGNVNYINLLNENINLGTNNTIRINHPYITMDIESSSDKINFSNVYVVNENEAIYTRVNVTDTMLIEADNVQLSINTSNSMIIDSFMDKSDGLTYEYDELNYRLSITVDKIMGNSNKYLIFKSHLKNSTIAESKLMINGEILGYYNNISTTKKYMSNTIDTNEIYVRSHVYFRPLLLYSLTDSSAAINLSKLGEETKITFLLKNTGQGVDSYTLNSTPSLYEYDVYLNNTFVKNVPIGTNMNLASPILNNLSNGEKVYVDFRYIIPNTEDTAKYSTMIVKSTSTNNINTTSLIPVTLQDP